MRTRLLYVALTAAGLTAFWAGSLVKLSAQSDGSAPVKIDNDDIGGVVTSTKGPEAGVWVIAETTGLPTKFSKTVVTDDRGRYVIPDLPKATYNVWSRGYGLVDSTKVQAAPGKILNLTAVIAPSAKAAADYYPSSYWYSLLKVPDKSQFPGTGPQGNGFSPNMKSQAQLIELLKTDSCWSCHQLGTKATRTIPALFSNLDSPVKQWERRVQSGQAGGQMLASISNMGKDGALAMFADWTNRIAAGELPPAPPRPQGVERNVVITQWDWASPKAYLHDEIATDKRNPNLNANGLLYGAPELSTDNIPILDPVHNTASSVKMPVRDPNTPVPEKPLQPSAYWGAEPIWDSQANMHNPMFDEKGRVWFTSVIRPPDNPAFCKEGSSHPSAKLFPVTRSGRQLAFYDPKSKQFTLIDTCFSTHHLQFDAKEILWTSSGGGGNVIGWLDVKKFEQTHDEQASQGWTGLILDTNGNGKRDAFVGPNDPVDPTKDKQIAGSPYGLTVSPSDGAIWGTVLGFPGKIVRIVPGSNPTETALTEVYELPWNNPKAKVQGFSPRGLDIDTNGVVWTVLSSGHFASFDRRKCTGKLNGPDATGQQCPEGWTLYPFPVPNLKGVTDSGSAEASYYDWVDQFDTFGLGKSTPIATGNGEDGLLAVVNGKWVTMRVPYPIGYFAKGLDGRIDDPKAGWKGKGLWSTYSTRTMFHTETGKGTESKVLHFQLRPDPLAN
ncbi:MAG TPA: carboxypeptidase-like regulatory domain-containing protein [Bryobacteraceae bacterium]|jgi:hypothetical protein|nr:carboxypeptidase-like regulatory domain-containing protein [Bryobacteraceae bacterium]